MDFSKRAKIYSNYRRADVRLTDFLETELDLNPTSVIADIGAGTGNYSAQFIDRGYSVYSVEPEFAMIENSIFKELNFICSPAEKINLPDASVDAVIAINCVHHFSDPLVAFHEVSRIMKGGKFAIFTFDPIVSSRLWMYEYWPDLVRYEFENYMHIEELVLMLKEIFRTNPSVHIFEIPADFQDRFSAALWKNPDEFLAHRAIKAMSLFNSLNDAQLANGYQRLQNDVMSGVWQKKYSHLLDLDSLDVGSRIIIVEK